MCSKVLNGHIILTDTSITTILAPEMTYTPLFYSGGVINVGIEILPTKLMQSQMSSGIAYFEGEVYNVMRQGRTSPPVPLLILGVEP